MFLSPLRWRRRQRRRLSAPDVGMDQSRVWGQGWAAGGVLFFCGVGGGRGPPSPLLLLPLQSFKSPTSCWRRRFKKKKERKEEEEGCATHTAGMSCMQSIESVSSGRRGGWGRVEGPGGWRWAPPRLDEKDEARDSLPPPLLHQGFSFFFSSLSLVGNYQ